MGDAPRNLVIVTEVRKARNPWESQSNGVELWAFHMKLVVDVRELDASMGVSSH